MLGACERLTLLCCRLQAAAWPQRARCCNSITGSSKRTLRHCCNFGFSPAHLLRMVDKNCWSSCSMPIACTRVPLQPKLDTVLCEPPKAKPHTVILRCRYRTAITNDVQRDSSPGRQSFAAKVIRLRFCMHSGSCRFSGPVPQYPGSFLVHYNAV